MALGPHDHVITFSKHGFSFVVDVWRNLNPMDLISGTTGGIISTLILHPLDLVKVRFQGNFKHQQYLGNIFNSVSFPMVFCSLRRDRCRFPTAVSWTWQCTCFHLPSWWHAWTLSGRSP